MSIAEKLQTIAENEQKVYDAGFEAGKAQGGGDSWYDTFWDTYQLNGTRENYDYAFRANYDNIWTEETFKPKYDIVPTRMAATFQGLTFKRFKSKLEELGIRLDTSKCTTLLQAFQSASLQDIPAIDARLATNMSYTFASSEIVSIEKLIVSETTPFSSTFNGASALETVIFEGTIGQNGLNLQHSKKLSRDSIDSIISCLSTTTSGLSITLSKTAVDNAYYNADESGNVGSETSDWQAIWGEGGWKPNWTCSLV